MEAPDGSPPQSLCMIRAAEFYPKSQMEKEDPQLSVPFQELSGESVKYLGRTSDGVLALSNYRICLLKNATNSETSVPLGLIEAVQVRDLFQLVFNCKDASTVKCSFETAEQCSEWQRRIQLLVGVPDTLEILFAFPFCSWTFDGMAVANGSVPVPPQNGSAAGAVGDGCFVENSNMLNDERLQRAFRCEDDFMREVARLNFDLNGSWRISHANEDFKLCPSYPRKILVPGCIPDDALLNVAKFRASRRLPAVVWRHRKSGAVIARSSQPEVGWLGWRGPEDEQLLKALADACAFDRGEQMRQLTQAASSQNMPSGESSPSSPDGSHEEVELDEVRKILIVDARSYTSAVTNRARGGGCECIEYYPFAEIEFMNLGNIHVIRKSFHALRQLCASPPDIPNWLGLLEKTMWLQHLSGLLAASMTVCHAIENKGRPVLVHCSDGWDRTPQIAATAQLCLDPYFRTVEGFRILVEREWLSFGHKFADRCGHGPGSDENNERCPVFLQWLDLVHQIHKQFPCSFEFSMGYLIKLAQHSLSCLFGTFLCNTLKERIDKSVFERTFSVWPFLSGPMYRNPLYVPNKEKVLWPAHNVRDLSLWTEVYLGSLGNQNSIDFPAANIDGLHGSMSPMVKTRSYGDLNSAGIMQNGISRRSSDPNMTVDPNLTVDLNSENDSIADIQSEREDSPDITNNLQRIANALKNYDPNSTENPQNNALMGENANDLMEETLQQFLKHQELLLMKEGYHAQEQKQGQQQQQPTYAAANGEASAAALPFYTSPCSDVNAEAAKGCEKNSTLPETVTLANGSAAVGNSDAATESGPRGQKNKFNELLNPFGDYTNGTTNNHSSGNSRSASSRSSNDGDNSEFIGTINANGVTIHKTGKLNLDMLESVDLGDHSINAISPDNGLTESGHSDSQENMWHGSVNTSTDTLVPIETHRPQFSVTANYTSLLDTTNALGSDAVDGSGEPAAIDSVKDLSTSTSVYAKEDRKPITNSSANCSILPKVHNSANANFSNIKTDSSCNHSRPNVLATSFVPNTNTAKPNDCTASSDEIIKSKIDNSSQLPPATANNQIAVSNNAAQTNPNLFGNAMEESILILPEHQKLEISLSGKCETVLNNVSAMSTIATTAATGTATAPTTQAVTTASSCTATPPSYAYAPFATAYAQRRRRTSSSNSRPDGFMPRQVNGSTISRFSLPGVRSLPMTPPGLPDRAQIALSCPDGLAHALSEQNIRLQQIVHEHKLRVDELQREMRDMRLALLKRVCPNCNNASTANDEQCSVLDNMENASTCSWEALEDQSGPSSCASSSTQPNATSIRWVPDHAVSRCTSCQTEFWLGRRKHHCRSCGQIFCADCSEFTAALPDEKLFSPVRLCGPCYHAVTTRAQVNQFHNSALLLQQSAAKSAASAVATTAAAAAAATSRA